MPRAVPRTLPRAGRDAAGRSPGSSRPASGAPQPPRVPRPSTAGGSRPAPLSVRRLPNPRLTGLGSGLFGSAVMFALGGLDLLLFGASLTVYGVLFLPVCVLTALWVRPGDLLAPPVVMPIAFAVGLLPVADGGNGAAARLMGLVTALATQAGWLYAGTLAAAVTILVRGVRRATARRRAATAQAVRRPR
ncbi:DUF6542 domain-containing protein [Streptomyces phaeofaciens]|uniref:DUF6542 domain-containing protein n=1 Tax=Streptomyces phaeofaciens TaxID=68254 RepID=UPI00369D7E9A